MIKSMTGYGKAEAVEGKRKITVEIRSLNSKQLDMSVRIPQAYRPLEYEVRNRIGKAVQRGKVDVYINVETDTAAIPVNVNRELFMAYYSVLKELGSGMEEKQGNGPCPDDRHPEDAGGRNQRNGRNIRRGAYRIVRCRGRSVGGFRCVPPNRGGLFRAVRKQGQCWPGQSPEGR